MEILFVLWIVLEGLFFPYRFKWKRSLDRKEHPLRMLYGPAVFLMSLYKGKKRKPNRQIVDSLKMLTGKENVKNEWYLFYIRRITLVFLCVGVTFGICLLLQRQNSTVRLEIFQRPETGEHAKEISAVVKTEEEEEEISLTVSPVKLTEQEINQLLETAYESARQTVLGENESFLRVSQNLHFPSEIVVESLIVDASWASSCGEYINFDGTLKNLESTVDGTLYVTLWYGDYEKSEEIAIRLIPNSDDEKENIQDMIQNYLDSEEQAYKKEIHLPDEIAGTALKIYTSEDRTWLWMLLLGAVMGVLLWVWKKKQLDEQLTKRSNELQKDYSEIVLRIALLQEAGMSMYNVWERLVQNYEKSGKKSRYIYEEMKLALRKMKNGTPEVRAFVEFGKRCGGANFVRLSGLLEHNITRGNRGFAELLYQEATEAMQEERNQVRKRGEELNSKLLLPMGILLALLLAMILVPSFLMMNIG